MYFQSTTSHFRSITVNCTVSNMNSRSNENLQNSSTELLLATREACHRDETPTDQFSITGLPCTSSASSLPDSGKEGSIIVGFDVECVLGRNKNFSRRDKEVYPLLPVQAALVWFKPEEDGPVNFKRIFIKQGPRGERYRVQFCRQKGLQLETTDVLTQEETRKIIHQELCAENVTTVVHDGGRDFNKFGLNIKDYRVVDTCKPHSSACKVSLRQLVQHLFGQEMYPSDATFKGRIQRDAVTDAWWTAKCWYELEKMKQEGRPYFPVKMESRVKSTQV